MSKFPTRAHIQQFGNWRCLAVVFTLLCMQATVRTEIPASWPGQEDITPETLTRCFADFDYELGDQVQDPEVFLQRKRGDCDDFATLVSSVLEQHGYRTRLVVVMMEQQTHVVCYVEEKKGYLDYNLRAAANPVVATDGSLEDIAGKVAISFHSRWRMASEVRYEGRKPVYMDNVFAPARPATSPELATATPAADPKPQFTAIASEAAVGRAASGPQADSETDSGPADSSK